MGKIKRVAGGGVRLFWLQAVPLTGAAAAAKRAGGQLHSCSQKLEGAADAACFLQRGMKPQPLKKALSTSTYFWSVSNSSGKDLGSGMPGVGSGLQEQWERGL